MPPPLRKLALTAHVTSSVGWLGAALIFGGLAIVGLTSPDDQTARAAYLVMEPTARYVLVPLALASLVTGVIQSLGTPWGLLRHYWVGCKLAMTVLGVPLLLSYLDALGHLADVAADPENDLSVVRDPSPGLHASLAAAGLLVATVLAVYKPRGMTAYGQRRRHRLAGEPARVHTGDLPGWEHPWDLNRHVERWPRTNPMIACGLALRPLGRAALSPPGTGPRRHRRHRIRRRGRFQNSGG
jgi:hypothetical protein